MIYVIADLHLGHHNIFTYEPSRVDVCKPQPDERLIDAFERALIWRWNKVVSPLDTVYVLGDVAFSNKERIRNFLSKVNGIKHLVMGNHDRYRPHVYVELGFESATRHPILFNKQFLLSHEPLDPALVPQGIINYFGHVHGDSSFNWERGVCVSVEQTDFKPLKIM